MFGFANGLLLLLLAAAVIDFSPVVRRRLSPASWWHDERLLFTPRGGDLRQISLLSTVTGIMRVSP